MPGGVVYPPKMNSQFSVLLDGTKITIYTQSLTTVLRYNLPLLIFPFQIGELVCFLVIIDDLKHKKINQLH